MIPFIGVFRKKVEAKAFSAQLAKYRVLKLRKKMQIVIEPSQGIAFNKPTFYALVLF